MSKHRINYVDMHPDPLTDDDPSTAAIVLYALAALLGLVFVTIVLFSL